MQKPEYDERNYHYAEQPFSLTTVKKESSIFSWL